MKVSSSGAVAFTELRVGDSLALCSSVAFARGHEVERAEAFAFGGGDFGILLYSEAGIFCSRPPVTDALQSVLCVDGALGRAGATGGGGSSLTVSSNRLRSSRGGQRLS